MTRTLSTDDLVWLNCTTKSIHFDQIDMDRRSSPKPKTRIATLPAPTHPVKVVAAWTTKASAETVTRRACPLFIGHRGSWLENRLIFSQTTDALDFEMVAVRTTKSLAKTVHRQNDQRTDKGKVALEVEIVAVRTTKSWTKTVTRRFRPLFTGLYRPWRWNSLASARTQMSSAIASSLRWPPRPHQKLSNDKVVNILTKTQIPFTSRSPLFGTLSPYQKLCHD